MGTPLRLSSLLLDAVLSRLGDALSPPTCAACDERLRRASVFCEACAASVEPTGSVAPELPPGAPLAFALYGGALAVALRRLKYEERPDLARPLGALLRGTARTSGLAASVVVPVPLHPRRLVERGYNQAALLAAPVASELCVPLRARALQRVAHAPQQAGADRATRLANVSAAFRVRTPEAVRGLRVLLVDDVATTGATLAACTAVLLAAGARSVCSLVVAVARREP